MRYQDPSLAPPLPKSDRKPILPAHKIHDGLAVIQASWSSRPGHSAKGLEHLAAGLLRDGTLRPGMIGYDCGGAYRQAWALHRARSVYSLTLNVSGRPPVEAISQP
jgi:hypothetical protein